MSDEILDAILTTANRYLGDGQSDAAQAAFLAAAALAPTSEGPKLGLMRVAKSRGQRAAAVAQAREANRLRPDSVAIELTLVDQLFDNLQILEALRRLRDILRRDPGCHEASARLGQIEFFYGTHDASIAAIEGGLAADMPPHRHLIDYGVVIACARGEFTRARRLIGMALDPEDRAIRRASIDANERVWQQSAALWEQSGHSRISIAELRAAHAAEQMPLASHLMRRLAAAADATAEELLFLAWFGHQLAERGDSDAGMIANACAARAWRMKEPTAKAIMTYATHLAGKGAVADAGQLFLRLAGENDPDISGDLLLRFLTFACAAGGLADNELLHAMDRLADSLTDPGVLTLAGRYLARRALDISGFATQAAKAGAQRDDQIRGLVRRFHVMGAPTRPRLALCLSGQLRSFRQTWPQTCAALAGWDVEVFVSTWSATGAGLGAHDTIDRVLPASLRDRLPVNLRARSRIEARYPRLYAAIISAGNVDEATLRAFYGTEHVAVLDEAEFEATHAAAQGLRSGSNLNQAKMFYTMHRVLEQRRAFEARTGHLFDAVIRVRPDKRINKLSAFDVLRANRERIYLTDYFLPVGVGDQMGLMSSAVADDIWGIWPALLAAGSPRCFAGASGRYNEFLLAEFLMNQGVGFDWLMANTTSPVTAVQAELESLWPALLADIGRLEKVEPEDGLLLTAFHQALNPGQATATSLEELLRLAAAQAG